MPLFSCSEGPFTGRQRALNKEPKLFSGLKFYNRELGLISLFQEVSKQGFHVVKSSPGVATRVP
ncbi:hypothetical protein YC2023_016271 [Brassica napus]